MKPNPRGAAAEEYAANVLAAQGYRIVARNFSSRFGEVDIIAQTDDIIAFIEVKARRAGSMVTGFEAVTPSKQRKIIAAAEWYLKTHSCNLQPRFDVFSIITEHETVISHDYLEGAFDSGAYTRRY